MFNLVAAALLAASSGQADTQEIKSVMCPVLGRLASSIMRARQSGVPISSMIEVANKTTGEVADMQRILVFKAYSQNQWSSEKFKNNAVAEFSNEVVMECWTK
jgi:hypothetical protein